MSSSSSIRKTSLSSSVADGDEIPLDSPPAYRPRQPAPAPRRPACSASERNRAALAYPRSAPGRPAFLAARAAAAVFSLVLFVLSFPAERVAHRGRWMSAVMSPSINAFIANALDLGFVLCRDTRSHPLQRLLWDGLLACGFAVSAGFMVKMTMGDVTRTDPTSSGLSAGLGGAMLFLLFSIMWVAARSVRSSGARC